MTYVDPLIGIARASAMVDRSAGQFANRRSGARLAQGDYRGAAQAQFGAGEIGAGLELQQQGRAAQSAAREDAARSEQEQIAFTRQALKAIGDAPDPLAEFDRLAPSFGQLGTDDAQIGQLRQGLQTGGRQFLDGIQQIVDTRERELTYQKAGDNLYVFEEGNPNPVNSFVPQPKPIEVGGVLVDPVTFQPLVDTREPKTVTVQNSDGSSSIVQIDQPEPVSNTPASGAGGADAISVIQSILPEARFTSGLRTPDQNRSAGGATNSFHLRGQAVDIAPPSGISLQGFRRQLESSGVKVRELIDEGDHWHVAWEGGSTAPNIGRGERVSRPGGGVRVVAQGANNGPTPAAARAEAREARVADRQARTDSRQLRRDFEALPAVKEFGTIRDSYNQVRTLARSGTNTDDVALTYSFMRMLDPTSVVREGEYALIGRANNLPGRVQVALARIDSGESLTPELRRAMTETAARVFAEKQSRYNEVVQQYRGYAQEDGFDPDRVVPLGRGSEPAIRRRQMPFQPTAEQTRMSQQIAPGGQARGARGTRQNPILINPADPRGSYGNVQVGQVYMLPSGEIREKTR